MYFEIHFSLTNLFALGITTHHWWFYITHTKKKEFKVFCGSHKNACDNVGDSDDTLSQAVLRFLAECGRGGRILTNIQKKTGQKPN